MGWLIASTSAGYAASLAMAGLGVALGGWRTAFVLSGLLPALGAAMLIAALRPFPNRIHPRPASGGLGDEMLRNRESRLLVAGYTGHSWEVVGMWAWIPAFLAAAFALKGAGTSGATTAGAYLAGLLHLFGATAALTMGRLSDRTGRRPVLVAATPRGLCFVTLGDSPVLTTAVSEVVRPGYLGGVLAWRGLAGFGAGAVAPLAFGFILDQTTLKGPAISWGLGFATLGLGGAVALACALLLRQHRPHAMAHGPHHVAGKRVGHEKRE